MFASSESRTPVARKEVDDRLVAPASTYVHTVLQTCGQGGVEPLTFRFSGSRVIGSSSQLTRRLLRCRATRVQRHVAYRGRSDRAGATSVPAPLITPVASVVGRE